MEIRFHSIQSVQPTQSPQSLQFNLTEDLWPTTAAVEGGAYGYLASAAVKAVLSIESILLWRCVGYVLVELW